MAQLNDTLVNGDLRVNGNIYGIITSAQSAASAEKLTNTAIKVASATSATSANELINKAIKVNSAGIAAASVSGYWSKADDNTDLDRVIGAALAGGSGSWTAGNAFYGSTTYDSAFTYNSKSNTLKVPNISATNISGNLTGVASSATSAKAADGLKSTAYKVASATSATNADKLTNARNIAASGDVTWSVSFNGTTGVTGNAAINSVPWSAISSHTAAVDTSTTDKFTTPKAVNDAITASMSTKASFKGPYTARSAIPSADLDKLSIYLVGPSGSGVDKYEEWILTGTTTAQMLQIGDTSTDLSNYAQKNGSYTALSAVYATATNTAQTMKSALSAGTAEKVQMQAKSDNTWYQSLFASTSTSSIWYDSDAKVQYNPSSNTFSSTNLYGTTVSGATISGTNITAATTVRGTNISGTNISGASKTATIDNLITSASRTIPTVNNKTITITTGASPATASFTLNQNSDKTITLGSMALKASGDYSTTSHNHYLSALNGTATYFSGTTAAPSALSALTSKSALSAATATYDSAGNIIDTTYGKKINDVYYVTAGYNATTYPNYDSTKTYAVGAYIVTGSRVYSASAAVGTAGAWSANSGKFTTASTTVVWSGNTTATSEVTALTAGLKISLKVPSNLSGAATTQLNLNSLGAKTIRRNNGNLTTHLPFGTIVYLTYDGTYWVWADYDSNSNNYVGQYSATDNNNYPIILKRTTGGQETQTVKYASAFTYNPSTSSLIVKNISGVNITATTFSGNLSGKAADSDKLGGTAAANFIQSGNSNAPITAASAKAAPVASHNHSYTLSGNGTAVNVSAGINFKPSGSNIKFYVSGNDIYISAKNDNSTAYIPSGFQISGINGTTTGVYYLSALKLNAGTNIGFTSASNSQITITAKDTTYTSLNGVNSTEYNALTSTSANSRNPNAHQLSSHTNFSTYFNETSANSALTSKSALSAGSASTAAKATWVAKTDNNEYKMAFSLNSEFNYNTNYTYNPSLQRLTIPSAAKIGGCTLQWNASTSALDFNF